ncbi:hypothetical protein [Rickettsiales endosymbiont of Stachyamoeba lipophora]|uniref:hypothetical protein n=1 Tax=Rickettsiales endosymbiont of Stachyamoeba lipophora TaxID=2486578 RepID=UPI000F6549AC|nr:hypothetical protein [Rickettsiales endosymbiont of Stachyamoeba lipophora]AZL14982.1 hypothetical protein EF513_00150 [Rickettsiales endosymbiont of Stachyamoeba lipophora]
MATKANTFSLIKAGDKQANKEVATNNESITQERTKASTISFSIELEPGSSESPNGNTKINSTQFASWSRRGSPASPRRTDLTIDTSRKNDDVSKVGKVSSRGKGIADSPFNTNHETTEQENAGRVSSREYSIPFGHHAMQSPGSSSVKSLDFSDFNHYNHRSSMDKQLGVGEELLELQKLTSGLASAPAGSKAEDPGNAHANIQSRKRRSLPFFGALDDLDDINIWNEIKASFSEGIAYLRILIGAVPSPNNENVPSLSDNTGINNVPKPAAELLQRRTEEKEDKLLSKKGTDGISFSRP